MSRAAADNGDVKSRRDKDKMKASHFPLTTFIVGNLKRRSTHIGNLTAKIYYARKKLVWEFLDGPLKTKMEVSWSDITAIEARMNPNRHGCLRIQLAKPPLFFREITPQPRKHTIWEKAEDFTNGQALLCRRHSASFPPGELDKHYEKLMLNDVRLAELNRRAFPAHESAYFNAVLPLQNTPQQQQQQPVLQLQHNYKHPTTHLLQQCPNSTTVFPSKREFDHAMQLQLQHQHQHQQPLMLLPRNFDLPQQKRYRPTTASLHQSLNSTSTATTPARNNGVVALLGNQISNEATLVDSSRHNQLLVPHQQYSSPQQHYSEHNDMSIPYMTIPSSSVQQNQLLVPHQQYSSPQQHYSEHNDMTIPYMKIPSSSVQQNQLLLRHQYSSSSSSILIWDGLSIGQAAPPAEEKERGEGE
ncbi:hypothetical protein AAHA92_19384 [Salvia divinorum]|uniref:TRF2/HOY1 PH-like domain-containing protein n=1 Tax=Salvia divinorum TaxID=28513 RepID=A0ABD1H570_SALDI